MQLGLFSGLIVPYASWSNHVRLMNHRLPAVSSLFLTEFDFSDDMLVRNPCTVIPAWMSPLSLSDTIHTSLTGFLRFVVCFCRIGLPDLDTFDIGITNHYH